MNFKWTFVNIFFPSYIITLTASRKMERKLDTFCSNFQNAAATSTWYTEGDDKDGGPDMARRKANRQQGTRRNGTIQNVRLAPFTMLFCSPRKPDVFESNWQWRRHGIVWVCFPYKTPHRRSNAMFEPKGKGSKLMAVLPKEWKDKTLTCQ